MGKPEEKRPLVRPRCRWEDNNKMVLSDIGLDAADWIDLIQDRDQWRALVNTVMNPRVPQNIRKFLSSCTTGGFSRWTHLQGVSYPCQAFVHVVLLGLSVFD
jgi:hypothetical protein